MATVWGLVLLRVNVWRDTEKIMFVCGVKVMFYASVLYIANQIGL